MQTLTATWKTECKIAAYCQLLTVASLHMEWHLEYSSWHLICIDSRLLVHGLEGLHSVVICSIWLAYSYLHCNVYYINYTQANIALDTEKENNERDLQETMQQAGSGILSSQPWYQPWSLQTLLRWPSAQIYSLTTIWTLLQWLTGNSHTAHPGGYYWKCRRNGHMES